MIIAMQLIGFIMICTQKPLVLLNLEDCYNANKYNFLYFWVEINGKAESETRYGTFNINVSNTKLHVYVVESLLNNHGKLIQQTKLNFDKNNCVKHLH